MPVRFKAYGWKDSSSKISYRVSNESIEAQESGGACCGVNGAVTTSGTLISNGLQDLVASHSRAIE